MAAAAEFRFWRRERDAQRRGLRQLKQLRKRALADPEFAASVAADDPAAIVPDDRGMAPTDQQLAVGYFDRLIAAYELRGMQARAQTDTWSLRLAPRRAGPRDRGRRSRSSARRRSPRPTRAGPDGDSEPHLASSPARAGGLGVEAAW